MDLEIFCFHEKNDDNNPYTRLSIFMDSAVTLQQEPVLTLFLPDHFEIFKSKAENVLYDYDGPIAGFSKVTIGIRKSFKKES